MIFGTGDSAGTSVNVKAAQDNATSVNLSSNNPIIQQQQPQPVQTECQPNSSALLMTTPSAVVAKNLYERKGPFSFPVVLSEPLPLPLPKDSLYGRTPIID